MIADKANAATTAKSTASPSKMINAVALFLLSLVVDVVLSVVVFSSSWHSRSDGAADDTVAGVFSHVW
jgi:hypothetical protein